MGKKFTRTKENFICAHCETSVEGSGYTNHCPKCLWSRHVDVNPGDRAEECGGMMEPVGGEVGGGKRVIVHRCEECGFERKNKLEDGDEMDAFISLVAF